MVEWWKDSFSLLVGNILEWRAGDLVCVFGVAGELTRDLEIGDLYISKVQNGEESG